MSKIIDFYRDEISNTNGNFRKEILEWYDVSLELDHKYIQWLFPSNEASSFNLDSPVLTQEEALIFQSDPELREKLIASFVRILQFFEMELVSNCGMLFVETLQEKPIWLSEFNHNMLRATRIIKSLRLLGLEKYALAFFDALEKYKSKHDISENTYEHWKEAAYGNLWQM